MTLAVFAGILETFDSSYVLASTWQDMTLTVFAGTLETFDSSYVLAST